MNATLLHYHLVWTTTMGTEMVILSKGFYNRSMNSSLKGKVLRIWKVQNRRFKLEKGLFLY